MYINPGTVQGHIHDKPWYPFCGHGLGKMVSKETSDFISPVLGLRELKSLESPSSKSKSSRKWERT